MIYDETLNYLYGLERFGIRLGLENISAVLHRLDNPHHQFNSIHITGTNGKGSTAVMIASILQSAGYKTGLYTSPHLQDFRERIMVNNIMIPEKDVIKLTGLIKVEMSESSPLTFFEFITIMAFLYFSKEKVDFAVVEVGMGGRLDATNVVNPIVSIITEVDIEHTDHLGKNIKSITREKGGIIKNNGVVILASLKRDVIETIESICNERHAKFYRIDRHFSGEIIYGDIKYQRFKFKNADYFLDKLEIPLLGRHQIVNASTAVETALILKKRGFKIGEGAIRKGLKGVKLKGRLEILRNNPFIVVDVAHNPSAAKILAGELKKINYNKLILILGILKDKDSGGIISFLAPIANHIIIVKPRTPRSSNPQNLKMKAMKYIKMVEIIEDISDAISRAINTADKKDLICITGSFFTVGEALEKLND